MVSLSLFLTSKQRSRGYLPSKQLRSAAPTWLETAWTEGGKQNAGSSSTHGCPSELLGALPVISIWVYVTVSDTRFLIICKRGHRQQMTMIFQFQGAVSPSPGESWLNLGVPKAPLSHVIRLISWIPLKIVDLTHYPGCCLSLMYLVKMHMYNYYKFVLLYYRKIRLKFTILILFRDYHPLHFFSC